MTTMIGEDPALPIEYETKVTQLTREDILKLAREAGAGWWPDEFEDALCDFTRAVFAAGRADGLEEAANVGRSICSHRADSYGDGYNRSAIEYERAIRALKARQS